MLDTITGALAGNPSKAQLRIIKKLRRTQSQIQNRQWWHLPLSVLEMRRARLMLIGLATAMVLSACAGGSNTTDPDGTSIDLPAGVSVRDDGAQTLERNAPVSGGTLRIAMIAAAESLDPGRTDGGGAGQALRAIFDELVRYDASGEAVPHLAESLESDDDGKTWVLKLRPGVKFTDGTPFNSQAVIDHWTRIGVEGSTSRAASTVRSIEAMVATNATTLTITLIEASPSFPKAILVSPGHVNYVGSPAAVAQWGDEVGFHPVGAGPFKVESFTSNGDTVLVRNPDYWREGLPYLDKLHFITAVDSQSRLSAGLSGDLDLAMSQIGAELEDGD